MDTGIYIFIYKNKYAYIGQSIDMDKRLSDHKKLIKKNNHPNLKGFGRYDICDFVFKKILLCGVDELNYKEKEEYDRASESYIMINKRECGIQGVNGNTFAFRDNDIPSMEYRWGNIYINGNLIDKIDDMYCVTDLIDYIKNNSDSYFRMQDVLSSNSFVEKINSIYGCNIPKDRRTVKHMKEMGVYRTIGARDSRKTYCSLEVFVTLIYTSCPQMSASISIMIMNSINEYNSRINKGYTALKESLENIDTYDIKEIDKYINYIVFNDSHESIRHDAGREEIEEICDTQKLFAFFIDMGYIKTFDSLIAEMRRLWKKKWGEPKLKSIGRQEGTV